MPGKSQMEMAFDQDTTVMLFMRGHGRYLGFQELILNEPIADEAFAWDGPVEQRQIGVGYICPDPSSSRWGVSWQISVRDRFIYSLDSPPFDTRVDATTWAEEHATQVVARDE
jgi:hypothetical protein